MDTPAPRPICPDDFQRILNLLEAFHLVAVNEYPGEPAWRVLEEVAEDRGHSSYPADPDTGHVRIGEDLLANELWWARVVLEALGLGRSEVVDWPTRPSAVCSEPGCPELAVLDRCWRHQLGLSDQGGEPDR